MNLISTLAGLLATIISVSTQINLQPKSYSNTVTAAAADQYRWARAAEPGAKGWPRWVMPVVGFGDRLWMVDKDMTWDSADGLHWHATKHNGSAAVKHCAGRIFFKNQLWMLGGMKTGAEFTNDVWASSDGLDWKLVNPHAAWAPRRDPRVVVFADKLWLFGGGESSGREDLPSRDYRDVWNSSDGINWTKVADTVPWRGGDAIVFQDRMWIIGRGESWSTEDGKNWKEGGKGGPALTRGGNGIVLLNGRIWLFGGVRDDKMDHDVWSSADGIHWVEETEHAPWFPRGGQYSIAYRDKLWIYGGKTGVDYDHADDIWYMARR